MNLYKSALIIDDDRDLCLLLKAMLTPAIPNVSYVHTLQNGRHKLETIQPDIVFLDNNLPDGRGIDFIEELKSILPGARIIMISAMGGLKSEAYKYGVDVFIEKPLTASNLKKALGPDTRQK